MQYYGMRPLSLEWWKMPCPSPLSLLLPLLPELNQSENHDCLWTPGRKLGYRAGTPQKFKLRSQLSWRSCPPSSCSVSLMASLSLWPNHTAQREGLGRWSWKGPPACSWVGWHYSSQVEGRRLRPQQCIHLPKDRQRYGISLPSSPTQEEGPGKNTSPLRQAFRKQTLGPWTLCSGQDVAPRGTRRLPGGAAASGRFQMLGAGMMTEPTQGQRWPTDPRRVTTPEGQEGPKAGKKPQCGQGLISVLSGVDSITWGTRSSIGMGLL